MKTAQAKGVWSALYSGERRKILMPSEETFLLSVLFPPKYICIKYSSKQLHAISHLILKTRVEIISYLYFAEEETEIQKT